MYQVDRSANRLMKLRAAQFGEHGVREREHLQEWLASNPEILGEILDDDLLVIQKEFDGFDGTRERLDLLAVDTRGQLVIIENKLDDSGRDVVWQALKYAAYCSTLRKNEIIQIYERYLHRQGDNTTDATDSLCEFLGVDGLSELVVNEGVGQRILFIAASFRREVTATVLWLRDYNIDARCIKVSPYELDEKLIVDMHQVIPPPEAAEYMIRMAKKEAEEYQAKSSQQHRHEFRREFWQQALTALREAGASRVTNLTATTDHWVNTSTGITGLNYCLVFLLSKVRVEFVLQRPSTTENKAIFDHLLARRGEIETRAGVDFNWQRRSERKRSSIELEADFDGRDTDQWVYMIDWLARSFPIIEKAFDPELPAIERLVKNV